MADRPILFSAPMVLGLIREAEAPGTGKTQTRRLLKPQPQEDIGLWLAERKLPYAIGDRLWVREAWRTEPEHDGVKPRHLSCGVPLLFEADDPARTNKLGLWGRLRPGIFMPRWASRLTLTVTDVRVQRLHSMSEEDAISEGIRKIRYEDQFPPDQQREEHKGTFGWEAFETYPDGTDHPHNRAPNRTALISYGQLWDTLNRHRAPWDVNPWVVAVSFTARQGNIDA